MNRPNTIEIWSGAEENDVIPSNANETIFLNEYFDVPENRSLGLYFIWILLKPIQFIIPLINMEYSPISLNESITFRSNSLKSADPASIFELERIIF